MTAQPAKGSRRGPHTRRRNTVKAVPEPVTAQPQPQPQSPPSPQPQPAPETPATAAAAPRDLREWIAQLEAAGELKRVQAKVDWDGEIGAITRVTFALAGPALLFENIKDYEAGRCTRLLVGGAATRGRVAMALGLPKDTPIKDLVSHARTLFRQGLPPVRVKAGPVKENILNADQVNLYDFPVPRWQPQDGGRYIDTCCAVITKDPDTGVPNVGIYRGMIAGKNEIAKLLVINQHWGQHFAKYRAYGGKMPIAIAYGLPDLYHFLACAPVETRERSEWDIIGASQGFPVALTPCETVPLEVPAHAEVVIEGFVSPDPETFRPEGPFGEFTGYFGGAQSPKPTVKVTAITHRHDPIFRGTVEGVRPGMPNEDSAMFEVSLSAVAWNVLEDAGVPGILDVWVHPVTVGTHVFVQIRSMYRNQAKQVAAALWGSAPARWFYKHVFVFEEDIDIRNPDDIQWALSYRLNAGEGDLVTYGPTFGSLLDPSTRSDERDALRYGTGKWTRVLFDCTRNLDFPYREAWGGVYPPLNKLSVADERKVAARWAELGIGIPYLSDEARRKLTMEHVLGKIPGIRD